MVWVDVVGGSRCGGRWVFWVVIDERDGQE